MNQETKSKSSFAGHWFAEEDAYTWQLFFLPQDGLMPLQIAKCPKKETPYAEYWPNEKETKFIVDSLNFQSGLLNDPLNVEKYYPNDEKA